MTTAILWFRRDLRLRDHPALLAAARSADRVLPVFVLDPALVTSSAARFGRLCASLAALNAQTDGALVVRTGDPAEVVAALAAEVSASEVHVTGETTPYGRRRDAAVHRALQDSGRRLVATGTPYAVSPGRVLTGGGTPYRVFTPFRRAWAEHGWRAPAEAADVRWRRGVASEELPGRDGELASGKPCAAGESQTKARLVSGEACEREAIERGAAGCGAEPVGERAALERWERFLCDDLRGYAADRDRPDLDATSGMSVHLKYGEVHPRTLLADLAQVRAVSDDDAAVVDSVQKLVGELAWREFYADVLWHAPESAWRDWRPDFAAMRYEADDESVDAWRAGRTGFPFVDAGMRQLLAQGWMHNRVRMVTASFLVKDLHVWWPVGARHFLRHLRDGDLASNSHGWQWVAGTGTDAAPYFRIFNPVRQGLRFDPDGSYVRRWVPELRHLRGAAAHEPWRSADGYAGGYPQRIVDHAQERSEALFRLDELRRG